MADNKNNDGPTIGERIGSTIVQGVKQGVIGIAAGGAAGAALGAVAGYAVKEGVEAAADNLNGLVDTSVGTEALNNVNQTLATTVGVEGQTVASQTSANLTQMSQNIVANQDVIGEEGVKFVQEGAKYTQSIISDGQVTAVEAKDALAETMKNVVTPALNDTMKDMAMAGGAAGAVAGGAGMGAKGAAEGLLNGSPTKHAERVAAKGTRRGIESIIQEAMERGQQEQVGFVQTVEKERSSKGATPPTLAV